MLKHLLTLRYTGCLLICCFWTAELTCNHSGPELNSPCLFLQEWKRDPPALTVVERLTEMHTGDLLLPVSTPPNILVILVNGVAYVVLK